MKKMDKDEKMNTRRDEKKNCVKFQRKSEMPVKKCSKQMRVRDER